MSAFIWPALMAAMALCFTYGALANAVLAGSTKTVELMDPKRAQTKAPAKLLVQAIIYAIAALIAAGHAGMLMEQAL